MKQEFFFNEKTDVSPFQESNFHKIALRYVARQNIDASVMVFMYDTLPECVLQMYEVSLLNISVIERTRFCEGQANEQKQGENKHAGVMFSCE